MIPAGTYMGMKPAGELKMKAAGTLVDETSCNLNMQHDIAKTPDIELHYSHSWGNECNMHLTNMD